jgi:hypothetical protein
MPPPYPAVAPARRMRFEYHTDSVEVYPDTAKMKKYVDTMMTPQRSDIIQHNFDLLCTLLMKGFDDFETTHTLIPAIKVTVEAPLESAMKYLWMLQAYTNDSENKAAFSTWCETASVHEKSAMDYFRKLPLYSHDHFTISVQIYELLMKYAGSALDGEDGTDAMYTLARDITRDVCTSLSI